MRRSCLAFVALCLGHIVHAQSSKFLPNDGASGDHFGASVAVGEEYLLVGAPQAQVPAGGTGAVYVFSLATGAQVAKLTSDPGDYQFGGSVAIDMGRALVGAPGGDGSAYLFSLPSGQVISKYTPLPNSVGPRQFGKAVALRGDYAVIGFPGENISIGSAYLISVPTGQVLVRLQDDVLGEVEEFGASVAIDDNYVLVGCPGDWEPGDVVAGSVSVFSVPSGSPVVELRPAESGYGTAIAMDDGYALIAGSAAGVELVSIPSGLVHTHLLPGGGAPFHSFGASIALRGQYAAVGAPEMNNQGFHQGTAYLYSVPGGEQLGKFSPGDGVISNRFGVSCSISNDQVFVGARGDDDNGPGSGSLYAWDISTLPGGVEPLCSGTACPCGNDGQDGVQGCANSVGSGATLEVAGGHPLVGADSLVLTTTGLPPGVMCVPFMGDTQVAPVPLGDGLRCAGGSLYRFPVQAASAQGTLLLGPGIVQQSCTALPLGACIGPGDQRYFQTWYRDPGGPCAFQANVSSALVMTFGL